MLPPDSICVLLVDDEPLILTATARYLRNRGMRTICSGSPFGVSALVCKEAPDVVVLDCNMPGLDGAHLMRALRTGPRRTAATPVVFHSGESEDVLASLATSTGAHYARKGASPQALLAAILAALKAQRRTATPMCDSPERFTAGARSVSTEMGPHHAV